MKLREAALTRGGLRPIDLETGRDECMVSCQRSTQCTSVSALSLVSVPTCVSIPEMNRTQVWRVAWNATGSMVSTSEDDGTVRVFQSNMDFSGEWRMHTVSS